MIVDYPPTAASKYVDQDDVSRSLMDTVCFLVSTFVFEAVET